MNEDTIIITDDQGNEVEFKIYFTFNANDKQYAILYQADNPEDLYPFVYDDNGNIESVDNEEEYNMIEEVLYAYENEEEK